MQSDIVTAIHQLTGKDEASIQDMIGKLSIDELYTLMSKVDSQDILGVEQMLDVYSEGNTTSTVAATESIDMAVVCKKSGLYESVLEWIEENNIPHSFRPGNTIIVSCQNTAQADYLVGMVESAGTPKKEVTEDKDMKDKTKVPASKPRDPMARELAKGQYQAKVTPNKKAKLDKSRTKHKSRGLDEASDSVGFWVDSSVAFDKVMETFGSAINFDGDRLDTDASTWNRIEKSLIAEGYKSGSDFGSNNMKKKTNVQEGVLGMTRMPGLRRMMELAGMPADQIDQLGVDADMPVTTEVVPAQPVTAQMDAVMASHGLPTDDLDADLGINSDDDAVELDGDDLAMADELGDPAPAGDFAAAVMDDGMDDGFGMDSAAPITTGTDASPAYTLISDALASIQSSLPDVKISEYKTLIQRLEELTNQLRQVGQSYLGD